MEENLSIITRFVNDHLGQSALALPAGFHITPDNPELPIPQHVIMAFLVLLIVTVLVLILRPRLSVERPGTMQQIAELLITNPMRFGIRDILDEAVDHGGRAYIYMVGTISLFVLFSNLFRLFPLFSSPTWHICVTSACTT